jgi:dTDP-4-dehydrorhamnose reductase
MADVLILGKDGQVGHELCHAFADYGNVTAWGRSELDLTQPDRIREALRTLKPRLVLNAAAYTAVDKAESEQAQAAAINAEAPRVLAQELATLGGGLIHYSTDYIFDGAKRAPYLEDDATHPLNVYGATKLAGEQGITSTDVDHLILRTSWVYSDRGKNFVVTMRRVAQLQDELKVVDDQTGSPTWARTIALTTRLILERCGRSVKGRRGVYHLTSAGHTTWHGFAAKIVAAEPRSIVKSVTPIPTSAYPTPAARPRYSVLSSAKLERDFGVRMPQWDADFEKFGNAR